MLPVLIMSIAYHILTNNNDLHAAKKPCDAAAVLFGLKFVNDIHYKFKSSQASKARVKNSKRLCWTEAVDLAQS